MKWDGTLPIMDRSVARVIAQTYLHNGCNMSKTMEELVPELAPSTRSALGTEVLREPAVMMELNAILNRTERNADIFVKKMWEWLNDESEGKEFNERRQTAARILAKGYIREKGPAEASTTKPMVISGLEDGIQNLTGEAPVKAETDPKKVV